MSDDVTVMDGADGVDDEQDDSVLREDKLTPQEKVHCQNLMVYGPAYLHQLGWRYRVIERFCQRVEIQNELAFLRGHYLDREAIQERAQFYAQLKINQMVPAAVGIIARALRGTVIKEGAVVQRPPERVQYDAAIEVLTRANIQGGKFKGNNTTPTIDARTLNVHLDSDEAGLNITPEGRERVRKMLLKIKSKMEVIKKVDRIENGRAKPSDKGAELPVEAEDDEEDTRDQ